MPRGLTWDSFCSSILFLSLLLIEVSNLNQTICLGVFYGIMGYWGLIATAVTYMVSMQCYVTRRRQNIKTFYPSMDNVLVPVTDGFHSQMISFDILFAVILTHLLNKRLSCRCFETPWRHCDGVTWPLLGSVHRQFACLSNSLFRLTAKKTLKLRITALCEGNPSGTGGFLSQRGTSNGRQCNI